MPRGRDRDKRSGGVASFRINLLLPKGVTRERMAAFILAELGAGIGHLDPWTDDLFYLARSKIIVIDSLKGIHYKFNDTLEVTAESIP